MLIRILTFVALLSAGFSTTTFAEETWRGGEFRSTVILTVTGNITEPTRDESSEDIDKFFVFNDVEFSSAAQFDYSRLAGLPQTTVSADFPMGSETIVQFEGPLFTDVIHAVGGKGEMVMLTALDGYAIEVQLSELAEKGAVLALKRDGIPFGIGDFGPMQLVFPRAERLDLTNMNDDWWIWSIYHINIE